MTFTIGEVLEFDCPFTNYTAYGDKETTWVPIWDYHSWVEDEDNEYVAGGIGKCQITIEEVFQSKTGVDIVVGTKRFFTPEGFQGKVKTPRRILRSSHLSAFITKMESEIARQVFARMEGKSNPRKAFEEASSSIMNYF